VGWREGEKKGWMEEGGLKSRSRVYPSLLHPFLLLSWVEG